MQVGVAVLRVGVIEVVEGRRAEAFAVAQEQVIVRVDRHGQGAAPTVLAAELLVLVAAHAQLGGKPLALEAVLHKGRPVPAAVLGKGGGTVETIFVPVAADNQAVLLIQGQVVLPIDRVAVGVECTVIIAEGIVLGVAVFTVAQFQRDCQWSLSLAST